AGRRRCRNAAGRATSPWPADPGRPGEGPLAPPAAHDAGAGLAADTAPRRDAPGDGGHTQRPARGDDQVVREVPAAVIRSGPADRPRLPTRARPELRAPPDGASRALEAWRLSTDGRITCRRRSSGVMAFVSG